MKKTILSIISMLTIIIFLFQTNIALATSTTELKNEQEENNQEIKKQQEDLKEVQENKSKTVTEIEQISTQINDYETEIERLDEKITTISGQISTSEKKIKESEKEYNKQQDLLNKRLVAIYENGETSYLDFLLSSDGLVDFISNYFLVSELATYDTDLLEKIEKQKNKIEQEKNKLEINKKELNNTKSSKASEQTKLKSAKTEKNKYVQQLSEEEQKIEQKIEQLREDNKAIDKKIQAAQSAIEAARKKQQTSGSSSGGKNPSGFIRPVKGYSITTGMYYSSGRYHGAVDFSGAGIIGSPVYAVADGYVVTTHSLKTSYGNYIIIAHYNGLYTLYAHGLAGSICVSEGQTVKQGQQIMRVGSTGNSTGPHLHFEVRNGQGKYANRINPIPYLP